MADLISRLRKAAHIEPEEVAELMEEAAAALESTRLREAQMHDAMRQATERLAAVARECEGLMRDAERYRWLRNKAGVSTDNDPVVCDSTPRDRECLFGKTLDDAIDAARAKEDAA